MKHTEDTWGLHWQIHPGKNRTCFTVLGWIIYCLINSILARPWKKVKRNTGPFTSIGSLNLPTFLPTRNNYAHLTDGATGLEMLRLSEDYATGKWLYLKPTLSTWVGEDEMCLKEKEELAGGGLTQMAHFSFCPDTTFYSSLQIYFLSCPNTSCFSLWLGSQRNN